MAHISTDQIKFTQMFLSATGYYTRGIDGIWGSGSEKAQQEFFNKTEEIKKIYICDPVSEKYIITLLPHTQIMCRNFMKTVNSLLPDIKIKVISGLRTYAQQQALYEQGRTKPGDRVTKAQAGQSYHNFGIAWDVGIYTNNGVYDVKQKLYIEAAKAAKSKISGMVWGGDWKSFSDDVGHYQVDLGRVDIASLRKKFESGTLIVG